MKKYKAGQLRVLRYSGEIIKILDKEYIVTQCVNAKYTCKMCAEVNKNHGIPCIQNGQYCVTDWNQQLCRKQIPANCYLKPKE